jgi:6-hydroxynicotinate 3-monooxygenase
MSNSKPRVAVVGGGIGGTTAAILLQQAGYECTVYEQAPAFHRVGAGINFAPNSTRVFRAMGVEKNMLKVGIQHRLKFNREWDTGRVTFTVPVPELTVLYGAPFLACHRGDLHDVLTSAVKPGTLMGGKRLKSLDSRGSGVRLEFEDGKSATADIVIGADGVHSKVREAILGPESPVYYGLVAYRSIFPRALLGNFELADNTKWWGVDRYVLIYFLNERRDEVYVVTGSPDVWDSDDFSPQSVDARRMRAAFEGFHPEVQRVLAQCSQVSRWAMLERPPRAPWSSGPIVLLGDACHPMTPHLGQGGGMAVEDAVMIVRCLESVGGEDPELAFRLYEANRFERTARVQRESQQNEWGRVKMDHHWLYGYDALTVPIVPLRATHGAKTSDTLPAEN